MALVPVEQHLARVLQDCPALPPLRLGLLEAQGCVLAEDVVSEVELPGFRNSAMDGYAARWAEVGGADVRSVVGAHAFGAGTAEALAQARRWLLSL